MTPVEASAAFVVALTGGIASGKTAVSNRFRALGVGVVDTDRIAHELVEPGQPLLSSLVSAFGPQILDEHGGLKRKDLRRLVFSDPQKRKRLEAIMHPAIRAEARLRIKAVKEPYCILVIPLLAETGGMPGIDRVLLVDVNEETQLARVAARDGVNRREAGLILDAQAGRSQRRAMADDVIENSGNLEDLDDKIAGLHQLYLGLAKSRASTE